MKLLEPVIIGGMQLSNRMVMAPLTRNRSGRDRVPKELNRIYYNQRHSAGLIITEATIISPRGAGYIDTPGIYNDDQIQGWSRITKSVQQRKGKIFCQLWHTGRSSHPDFHNGEAPLSASAIKPVGKVYTYEGLKDKETPKEMTKEEIESTIEDYAQAARNSIIAGFDGVEIHGANGYLIDQFLCDGSNKRNDEYGGSIDNRHRFAIEVVEAVGNAIGFNKTAIRFSPFGRFNDMSDSDPSSLFGSLVEKLDDYELAYIHINRPFEAPDKDNPVPKNYLSAAETMPFFRKKYKGDLIACTNYDKESGEAAIKNRETDLVAFGKLFLANPDLPKRFAENAELNEWDSSTFYGGNEKGYIDYPFL